MPSFDPSTHDDLIDISITLSQPLAGVATLTTILILQDDVTPGGGLWAEYTTPAEVAADVVLTNLDATSQAIADIMFDQNKPPERIIFGAVDLAGTSQTAPAALDLIIADGASFYGVLYQSRTVARTLALAVDIEAKEASGIFLLLGLQDDDSDWITTGIPAAWSTAENFERTVMYYHDDNGDDAVSDRLECASFADRLSWSPDTEAVAWNAPVTSVDALTAALTQTEKAFARANFANTALPFGTRTDTHVDPGQNLNGRPVDHIVAADWLRARLAESVADLITETAERGSKLTVDLQGQNLLAGRIEGVFDLGVDVGHFADYELRSLPITTADIAAQRLRFDGEAQQTTGVRQVQISLFFGTDPIA